MPRKKIQPLFEEPQKKEKPVKKEIVPKTTTKKEVKPKAPVKPVAKKVEVKSTTKVPIKKSPVKKEVTPKVVIPPKKEKPKSTPKVKVIEIEEIEETIEPKEEPKIIPKEPKRKPRQIKNEPPKNIKHKLKIGTRVIVTFLGQPYPGSIIELSPEGMYKVKSDRGIILPRAKHVEGEIPDKYYPSYIIKVL